MEALGDSGFGSMNTVKKKRRSDITRRPRSEQQLVTGYRDMSAHPSTAYSNNSRNVSPEENVGSEGGFRRKEYYLNNPPRSGSVNRFEGTTGTKKHKRDYKVGSELDGYHGSGSARGGCGSDLKRCSEGVLAPANWKIMSKAKEKNYEWQSTSPDDHNMHQSPRGMNLSTDNKLRKVKLKVGGVTRTIHAKSNSDMGDAGPSSAKPSRIGDASRRQQNLSPQEDNWKDSSGFRFSHVTKEDTRGKFGEGSLAGHCPSSDPVRKSKRVSKRRALNSEFDDAGEDDEIRYLEKLKFSKVAADHYVELEDNEEDSTKKRKVSKIPRSKNAPYEVDEDFVLYRSNRENQRNSRLGKEPDDTDADEEEPGSDGPEATKVESPADVRAEPLTTRQRARQSGKSGNGESLIEFPNGLPPAPSRKHKEKLSEVEIQAKKAEVAQRRKMQVEKADREAQAEVIRKVRGLDSDKRKEEKKQKELEEREKAAQSQELAANSIRWVIGQNGTIVTFGEDVGLPSLFTSNPCSYPPPREKCAGPSCTNLYKYRDSKSKLPLCSLQCYRAVQGSAQSLTSC